MRDGPLQRAHATHRATDDQRPPVDPERAGERGLGGHLIAHREKREPGPPRPTVRRRRARSGGALAPAEDVGRDDEPAVGVQGGTGSDQAVPPARARVARAGLPHDVTVAGQGVEHEDRVVALRRQPAPGLERDADLRQRRRLPRAERADVRELPAPDRVALPPRDRGRGGRCDGSAVTRSPAPPGPSWTAHGRPSPRGTPPRGRRGCRRCARCRRRGGRGPG